MRSTNPDEFLHQVEAKAEAGDTPAEMVLADAYERGQYGLAQDDEKALQWYQRAAEAHNGDAELAVAEFYQEGRGVPRDPGDADSWLQMAVNDGNAQALDFLADSYLTGRGVAEDDGKAVELYRRAAHRDVVQAEVKLAGFYFNGHAVSQSYGSAYYWLRLARANPLNGLFSDLDAAVNSAAARITPAERAHIDKQVDAVVAKLRPPTTDCRDAVCITPKR